MKYEIDGVAIRRYGLKSKMFYFLVDDRSHVEHKYVLLNNKCWRPSMNGTQSKNHKPET